MSLVRTHLSSICLKGLIICGYLLGWIDGIIITIQI